MRFTFILSILLFGLSHLSYSQKTIKIVIDPGHGGKDPGHESHNSSLMTEKELNLKISLFLGGYLEKYLQNIEVVYTRTTDVYPTLDDRVSLANKVDADYFISIHCNGNERKSIKGTESHVHSLKSTKSVALAKEIENQFANRAGRYSRGVKDGNDRSHSIQVLKFTSMTSVLVECGFLTNEVEANYLNTTSGQEVIASAIFRGIRTQLQKNHPGVEFVEKAPESAKTNYTIQLMSSIEPIEITASYFKNLPEAVVRVKLHTTNAYKYLYTMGNYKSKSDANSDLKMAQSNGFKDAFLIELKE